MNFSGKSAIVDKIKADCAPYCNQVNEMKKKLKDTITSITNSLMFDQTVNDLRLQITALDAAVKTIEGFTNEDYTSLLPATSNMGVLRERVQALLQSKEINNAEVKKILMETILNGMVGSGSDSNRSETDASEEHFTNVKDVKDACTNKIFEATSKVQETVDKTLSEKNAVEEKLGKLQSSIDEAAAPDHLSNCITAYVGLASAVNKFKSAYDAKTGKVNGEEVASGLLDVLNGIGTIVGPPFSTLTGAAVAVFQTFTNGGVPNDQDAMKKLFKEQNKMIKKEFKETRKYIKEVVGEENLEVFEAKAMGILDTLNSKYYFISSFDGVEECLSDTVASEITDRIDYFGDQSDTFTIRHYFDLKCPALMKETNMDDSVKNQRKVCATLLYTEMVIEENRKHILMQMMGLLSRTNHYHELIDGYLQVGKYQEQSLTNWLTETILKPDTYCIMFHFDMAMWDFLYSSEKPRSTTRRIIQYHTKTALSQYDDACLTPDASKGTVSVHIFP